MTPLIRTEIEARIAAIEKRLEAATPGPWQACNGDAFAGSCIEGISHQNKVDVIVNDGLYDADYGVQKESDAELIASCPSDLRYLLSIVKAAMGLYDVVDDNKKASEQGFQVYPLEKDIHEALTAFEKAVRGRE